MKSYRSQMKLVCMWLYIGLPCILASIALCAQETKLEGPKIIKNLAVAIDKGRYQETLNLLENLSKIYPKKEKIQDEQGRTPAHWAALNGRLKTLMFLASNGYPLHLPDKGGNTPLHLSVRNGYPTITEFLLDQGIKKEVLNREGKTPLQYAKTLGFLRNLHILEKIKGLMAPPGTVSKAKIEGAAGTCGREEISKTKTIIEKDQNKSLPKSYKELLNFVVPPPYQGSLGTCHFMASTGAMEVLLNQRYGVKNPQPFSRFDLSERYLISQENHPSSKGKNWLERPILRFRAGAVAQKDFPFVRDRKVVWKTTPQDLAALNVMKLPQVQTRLLFDATTEEGGRWTAGVLQEKHIQMIKESLVQFKSPVVVNYNQGNYWHVVVIVGYDDEQVVQDRRVENALKGKLLPHWRKQIQKSLQSAGGQLRRKGVFYVRDSGGCGNGRGQPYSIRSYDWFKYLGNAAFVPYLSH